MAHTCQNLLIRCMDFRLEKSFQEWLKQKGLVADTDIVSVAGACKDLATTPPDCKTDHVMAMIVLAYEKHGVRNIILTQHQDCGAYGGQEAFASAEAEEIKLIADMKKVKEQLVGRFVDLKAQMYWIKKTENDQWEFEEIIS